MRVLYVCVCVRARVFVCACMCGFILFRSFHLVSLTLFLQALLSPTQMSKSPLFPSTEAPTSASEQDISAASREDNVVENELEAGNDIEERENHEEDESEAETDDQNNSMEEVRRVLKNFEKVRIYLICILRSCHSFVINGMSFSFSLNFLFLETKTIIPILHKHAFAHFARLSNCLSNKYSIMRDHPFILEVRIGVSQSEEHQLWFLFRAHKSFAFY